MKKTLREAFSDRIETKLRQVVTTAQNPYTACIYVSEHGAGSEFRDGELITASSYPSIFVPQGWAEKDYLQLERWIDRILVDPEIIAADNIQISWLGYCQ